MSISRAIQLFLLTLNLTLFTLVGSALTANTSNAAIPTPPVQLGTHHQEDDLAPHVSYFEDSEDSYTFEQIQKNTSWQSVTQPAFNQGYSTSTYWLKFSVVDGYLQDQPEQLYLQIAYPMLDELEVFELSNLRPLKSNKMGDSLPFAAREIQHRDFIYSFQLAPNEEKEFYLKVRSNGALQIPLNIWNSKTFIENENNIKYGYGLYYGAMLIMVFYNLFLFVSIRHSSYLFYIGYICSFLALQLATSGIGYQYIWPTLSGFEQISSQVTVALTSIFGIQFTRYFLSIKALHPRLDKALVATLTLSFLLLALTPFCPVSVLSILSFIVSILFLSLILFAAFYVFLKGHRQARFFLAGWVFFLVGGSITVLMMMGLLPVNTFTLHASKYGSVLEVILLSLALADRINLLQLEKRNIQYEAKLQLELKNRELADSNKLKDQFLATISHELRTPMNGVVGVLELLNHSNPSEYEQDKLAMGLTSAQEMMLLVNNILSLSELEARTLKLKPQNFSLQKLGNHIESNWQKAAKQKNLSLNITIQPDIPQQIRIDINCLQQVIDHLISNALKFTASGQINCSIHLYFQNNEQAEITIEVTDTGPGIEDAALAFLLQPFTQADGSFQRKHGGIGIGLAICKRITHLMSGTLTHKPNPEGGCIFTVTVPTQLTNELTTVETSFIDPTAEQELTLNQPHKILVVEDNIVNQKVACAILKKLGYESVATVNGQEALDFTKNNQDIDLILMDCQMPVMDGFTATEEIRKLNSPKSDIPIIAVTANAMSIDRERCLNAGMNDYLSKPIHFDELRVVLLNWLPHKKAN